MENLSNVLKVLKAPLFLRFVGLAALLLLFVDGFLLVHKITGDNGRQDYWLESTDYSVYYVRAARAIDAGQDPYNYNLYYQDNVWYGSADVHDQYVYPPLFAEFVLLTLWAGEPGSQYIWLIISVCSLVASLGLMGRSFGFKIPWPYIGLLLGLTCLTRGGQDQLYTGQTDFFLLFLLVFGLWLLNKKQPLPAGIVWGLMFTIKPFLGLFILYLFWKKAWKCGFVSVIAAGGFTALSFGIALLKGVNAGVIGGWIDALLHYSTSAQSARPDNYSIESLFMRLFTSNIYTRSWFDSQAIFQVSRVLLFLGLAAIFILLVNRKPITELSGGAWGLIEVSIFVGLGMVFGPLTEGNHFFLLLPGLFGWILVLALEKTAPVRVKGVWIFATALWIFLFFYRLDLPNIGIPSGVAWTPVGGIQILLTGLTGYILFLTVLFTSLIFHRYSKPVNSATS